MTAVYPQYTDVVEVAIDCNAPFAAAAAAEVSVGCNQMDIDDYCTLKQREMSEEEMNVSDSANERDENEHCPPVSLTT
jgi:hypothetical protein